MNHIEEFRDALYFVHHDCVTIRGPQDEFSESLGSGRHLTVGLGPKQVHKKGFAKHMVEPRRFPGATGAEKKEAPTRRTRKNDSLIPQCASDRKFEFHNDLHILEAVKP